MAGTLSYVDAFEERMRILSPSRKEMDVFLLQWKPEITPGAIDLIRCLQRDKKEVILLSGGISEVLALGWNNPS